MFNILLKACESVQFDVAAVIYPSLYKLKFWPHGLLFLLYHW